MPQLAKTEREINTNSFGKSRWINRSIVSAIQQQMRFHSMHPSLKNSKDQRTNNEWRASKKKMRAFTPSRWCSLKRANKTINRTTCNYQWLHEFQRSAIAGSGKKRCRSRNDVCLRRVVKTRGKFASVLLHPNHKASPRKFSSYKKSLSCRIMLAPFCSVMADIMYNLSLRVSLITFTPLAGNTEGKERQPFVIFRWMWPGQIRVLSVFDGESSLGRVHSLLKANRRPFI